MGSQTSHESEHDIDPAMQTLEDFVARHKGKLSLIVGGAMVMSVLMGALSPAEAAEPTELAAANAYANSLGLPDGNRLGLGVMASRTTDDAISEAQAALEAKGDLNALANDIETRRNKLANASRELDNLQSAIRNEHGLDAEDHREAVAAAAEIYNEAVAEAELGYEDITVDAESTADAVTSTTDILKALHKGF